MPTHALVLTAGLGTRLQPLTMVRAKPAVPIGAEPLIRRIVRWLVSQGVVDLTLNLHHLPETITAVVGDGHDLGARVRYSWEPAILGSAGGPRRALDIVGARRFFVINGDTLTDLQLEPLAVAHERSGAWVTLALVPNVSFMQYGGVRLREDGAVAGFVPRGPRAEGSFHFIGVQVVERDVFESLRPDQPANSVGEVYDRLLLSQPGRIRGVAVKAEFWDVGTVGDYWRTCEALAPEGCVGSRVRIDGTAMVTRSILWNDVTIAARAIVDRCIVTDHVRIPEDAVYRGVVLRQRAAGELIASPIETV